MKSILHMFQFLASLSNMNLNTPALKRRKGPNMSPATTSGFFSSEGSVARYPASSASSHAVSCFVMVVGAWAEVEYRKEVDDALVNTVANYCALLTCSVETIQPW